ncbi:hypothetical protein KUCAC02_005185 [Chaenocephalus aceratus]|uniref:Uncharacterized protein n=1 Tax=Chaenocephalus aceratus TaxID=36190 RepID=A0ACB9WPJ9_CHAAC|nr:hypothetical protein KUCAC02_005185 [Chaenocephalus aceratus]
MSTARCASPGADTGGGCPPSPPAPLSERVPKMNSDDRGNDSMPSMATTAVGVSIFLLTTTACLVVKSRLYPCQSHSRRSSDQLDLMVDGLPVSLPSYEEAIQSDGGHRPLLSSPDNAPPPYEEVQSSRGRARSEGGLHVEDKDP